jgi:protein TonB
VRAFPLTQGAHLPLTGEFHPLRREFEKWLTWANAAALATGVTIFGAWYVWSQVLNKEEEVPRNVQIVKFTELGVPPSIKEPTAPQLNIAEAVAPPPIGVPEPVPDDLAQQSTIATQSEMSDALAPITASDLMGRGDSIVVDLDDSPDPGDFVPFDELPVLLSIKRPPYPELAREAGFDATVKIQVLVGKDGKVKQAIALDGEKLFQDPSVAAARAALFKPALRNGRPVEVWIVIPFSYSLQK